MPAINALDHLVLTVRSIDATVAFYTQVLGMTVEAFQASDGTTRTALKFGRQKINLHPSGGEFEPKAGRVQPGSADLCLLSDDDLAEWSAHFAEKGVGVILGPVPRTGARGGIMSLYIRDPDDNLIEISRYD
jgi:catechol 2,3-dioxygenase-like lactoylglutathione lyase family enzyme